MSSTEEKNRFIAKICQMYYIDDMSQQEIASKVNISRPQISKLLKQGKEKGIVHITVDSQYSEVNRYSALLMEQYNLREAFVVDTTGMDMYDSFNKISQSFNYLFDKLLKDNYVIGVMAGQSINRISKRVVASTRNNINVYPLVGGFGPQGEDWQANSNTRNFAEKMNCSFYQLNCPAYINNEDLKKVFLSQNDIRLVLDMVEKTDIAVISVGQSGEKSTLENSGIIDKEAREELNTKKAVASVCASFLDLEGKPIECLAAKKMIGCTVQELKHVPNVIAVAYGNSKVEAIRATLKGGWMNYLVTDLNTAKQICSDLK